MPAMLPVNFIELNAWMKVWHQTMLMMPLPTWTHGHSFTFTLATPYKLSIMYAISNFISSDS